MTRDLIPPPRALSRLRLLLLCVAVVPFMSGCAWLCKFCQSQSQVPKQVAAVIFDVAGQRAVVLPDPINYRLADGPGFIEWRLPAGRGCAFRARVRSSSTQRTGAQRRSSTANRWATMAWLTVA